MTAPIWLNFTDQYLKYKTNFSLQQQYLYTEEFYNDVESLCDKNSYNIVAHKHLGDVFYFLGLKKVFEKQYGARLRYILNPQHEFIAKLWEINDYVIYPLNRLVRNNPRFITTFFDTLTPDLNRLDHQLENPYFMGAFSSIPQKGKPFIIDNIYNSFYDYPYYWCFRWAQNLGIQEEFRFEIPKGELPLSDKCKEVVARLGGLNKIILLAPEAATSIELPPEIWNALAAELNKKGYTIIINSKRINVNYTYSAFDLNLTLEDIVSIGLKCHAVFSLRSGLADVLVGAGERLYVFNPAMLRREQGSLDYPFVRTTHVNEIQLYNWDATDANFEGLDLRKFLLPFINALQRQCYKECILRKFHKHGHDFWYRVHSDIAGISKAFPENNLMNPEPKTQKLSIFGFKVYERAYLKKGEQQLTRKRYFYGALLCEKGALFKKIRLMGIPIYSKKLGEYYNIKVMGISIIKRTRKDEFLEYLNKELHKASEEVYGKGIVADHVFIVRHNMGESTLYYSQFLEWAKHEKALYPLLIIWRRKDLAFVKLFLGDQPYIRFIPFEQFEVNSFLSSSQTVLGECIVHTPTYRIAENLKEEVQRNPKINFAQFILKSMGLNEWQRPILPNPLPIAVNRARWLLNHLDINKDFVLLCPEAMSLSPTKIEFWEKFADYFAAQGYDILINVRNSDSLSPKLNKYNKCSPDIDVLFALAKKAHRIISMASGLGVLLSLSGRKIDLIYTDFKNKSIGYDAELALKVYSVKYLPWNNVSQVNEHIYDNSDSIFETIIKHRS